MLMDRRQALQCGLGVVAAGALWPAAAQSGGAGPVVASFSLLADMAREIAPLGSEVTALVGADSDAHVYAPKPADAKRLARADVVVVNGLGFEGWIDRMVKAAGYGGPVVVASRGIKPRGGGHHGEDPHAWQDLGLALTYVDNISAAFVQRWPAQRAQIEQRSAQYRQKVQDLDQRIRRDLAAIPAAQRKAITSHDAFAYFGAAYGVTFLSPQAWTTHSEPSAAAVGRLIRQIKQSGVKALFLENISDPRLIERIAKESGSRVGGTLYSDALSGPGGPASSYLAMMEHNARTLVAAFTA
ncbi:metal ABC transporter solute-binding protein, Zn/Mn family [Ideonella sp.]|jgi:zinc/manganese transport system substrate-binding protein|uniref:metal ABC transporter solute-binding protein, Zn/Mn family n=1 Tax=Ideonella sp. TaxID=1929293 RepID=UPI0037BEBB91